jgi:AraC-like DNA-binding protein
MINDSIVTSFDLISSKGKPREKKPGCTFWTGRDGEMCVQNFRPEEDVHYHPHTHSEYTIVVCLEGEILKTQLGQTHVIGRGGVMIGNHGVEHSSGYMSRSGKPCQSVSLSLNRRLLASLSGEFRLPPADGDTCPAFTGKLENSIMLDCAEAIAEELTGAKPGHKIVIETLATRLVVEAMRAWPRTSIEKIEADMSHRLPRKDFVRAYEFMRWCRKDSFSLDQLCRYLGSSQQRFTRLFLASTNNTPASFYNRMLLDRSLGLLGDPKLSIKEIGYDLGFKTSSHFIAAFRREFATSPQEYRQRAPKIIAA